MNSFFILQNTQSGKLSLTAKEIRKWSSVKEYKVITFFVSSNDRTLVDQTSEGISYFLEQHTNIFVLSSNSSTSLERIKMAIELYANDRLNRYNMPIITSLANKHQNARILELVDFIQQLAGSGTAIKYAFIFDEADSTYPILREQSCLFRQKLVNYSSIFVEDTKSCHSLGFVTATEGCLIESEFPECATARLCEVERDEFSVQHYRGIHTKDAVLHEVEREETKNNDFALKVMKENLSHFMGKLKDGSYRKIIVNSNTSCSDMEKFAEECVDMGMNAIVFNMNGLHIYSNFLDLDDISVKNKRFNFAVFEAVEKYHLNKRPLVIIGRRKVDRGLSFHYAPRDGKKGLIWTDIILGHIEDTSLAVQKAGRLAGIIAHSPDYMGECHYWATVETIRKVVDKNCLNDKVNEYSNSSILEAINMATDAAKSVCSQYVEVQRYKLDKKQLKQVMAGKLDEIDPALTERLSYYKHSSVKESDNSYLYDLEGSELVVEFYNGLALDPRADIPFIVSMEKDEMDQIMESVVQVKRNAKQVLLEKYPYLEEDLEEYEFDECRVVESLDFLFESSLLGRKIGYASDKTQNSYHILLHPESCRMAMLVWNGTSLESIDSRCVYNKTRGKYAGEKCGKKCEAGSLYCDEHRVTKVVRMAVEDDD